MNSKPNNPLSSLYFLGLRMDRYFTDSQSLGVPVVSVGNISSGGRSKTPFVIEICKRLVHEGYFPVVLTRGYGRNTKRSIVLDWEQSPKEWDAQLAGDEALEIAFFAKVPVLVGPRRFENAKSYMADHPQQKGLVFVLDDGFQHWKMKRDFDLVLTHRDDYYDKLLPLGRLREPVSSLQRAHLVLEFEKDFEKKTQFHEVPSQLGSIFYLTTRAPGKDYRNQMLEKFPSILGLVLADHAGIERIQTAVERANPDSLVLGAKEAVKILSYEDFAEFVQKGFVTQRFAGRNRNFIFAHCQLLIKEEEKLWKPLLSTLLRASAKVQDS